MHLVGYDSLNRPIIYSCLALATNKVRGAGGSRAPPAGSAQRAQRARCGCGVWRCEAPIPAPKCVRALLCCAVVPQVYLDNYHHMIQTFEMVGFLGGGLHA